jgi:hypothetical protein
MTGVALYALADQYKQLAERLASMDIDAQTVADTIEASGLTDDIAEKACGIEMVARTMEMHTPAIDAEIERLTALKKQRQKAAAGLRDYLKTHMIATGIQKIEAPLFKIKLQNNPPSVDLYEPDLIPLEYMFQPDTPPPAPDRTAIKAAIKAGKEVPGARMTQGQRLVVA